MGEGGTDMYRTVKVMSGAIRALPRTRSAPLHPIVVGRQSETTPWDGPAVVSPAGAVFPDDRPQCQAPCPGLRPRGTDRPHGGVGGVVVDYPAPGY